MVRQVLINLFDKAKYIKSELNMRRNINLVYKELALNSKAPDLQLVQQHQKYWSQLRRVVNPKWFRVYTAVTGTADILYVPENIYHNDIEEKLNNKKLAFSYKDKNFYELFYDKIELFPDTLLRNINGFFYDRNYQFKMINPDCLITYLRDAKKIIIKPSIESGGGRKIELFNRVKDRFFNSKGEELTLNFLRTNYGNNYIIQNYIKQSTFTSQFNETSVNTFRTFIYRSVVNDEIHVLHIVLRIGKKGNFVDDQNFGGLACLVKGAVLNNYATDRFGRKYTEVNGINLSQAGEIPNLQGIINSARYIASKNIHSRLMGLDFCLDERDNVKLVEINNQYAGINFFQMNSVSVFGKYTDEIIEYCKSQKLKL